MADSSKQIRSIRTEQDLEKAIERISELMGADPGTSEGDELDALATLVVAYEDEHCPMNPPDQAVVIEFRREQLGMP